ncbi:DUF2325 domain-containing protein [Anaeromicrobium sediminis]|uniref:Dihydroorotate dehydrogenase n=1 Tax=Anaeromicrobium sediminis TaxID=1478221 RepID=A0A267MMG9_9FIRM|nr:DUF2325 domain-containing protein [Anaeromicrobium sediminis]PAB59940.1 hypothetical protein CCE28_08275 [Anaeromicrobium sediminis]
MTALVVGADKLGNIPDILNEEGITDFIHWKGRKKGMRNMTIPKNIDMVIVLYDYIEHNLAKIIKKEIKNIEVPCVFAKRSVSDLKIQLEKCRECRKCVKNM